MSRLWIHLEEVVLAVIEILEYWNGGKMEYWGLKADHGLILFSGPCHFHIKTDRSPLNPAFHYSIIPRLMITAQPIVSDLPRLPARRAYSSERGRARFSMLE